MSIYRTKKEQDESFSELLSILASTTFGCDGAHFPSDGSGRACAGKVRSCLIILCNKILQLEDEITTLKTKVLNEFLRNHDLYERGRLRAFGRLSASCGGERGAN